MDLLILGPAGIIVLEIKTYTGHCEGHGDSWFSTGSDGTRRPLRGSPSRQVKRAAKSVAHYLVDCELSVPLHPACVFRPGVTLALTRPTVPVLLEEALLAHILALPPAPQPIPASELEPLFAPTLPTHRRSLPQLSH